jgi:hypothetical protein
MSDNIKEEELNKLAPYAKKLFEEVRPLLDRIQQDKIDKDNSKIEVKQSQKNWVLNILIKAKDERVPPLELNASKDELSLWFGDTEIVECYGNPEKDYKTSISGFIDDIRDYLTGITIVEYYDKKNRLFKKRLYAGINTDNIKEKQIGPTTIYGFVFFRKTNSVKKITYSFI